MKAATAACNDLYNVGKNFCTQEMRKLKKVRNIVNISCHVQNKSALSFFLLQ